MTTLSIKFNENYVEDLANLEQKLSKESKKTLQRFNRLIKRNWLQHEELTEIFDMETGGVIFSDAEWYLTKSPYKTLFSEKFLSSNLYMVNDDFCKILRGPWCYYYLVCSKDKNLFVDSTTACDWLNNLINFISKLKAGIESLNHNNDQNKKFYLAICDHIRLLLTLIINFLLSNYNQGKNYLYTLNPKDKDLYDASFLYRSLHHLIINALFSAQMYPQQLLQLIDKSLFLSRQIINIVKVATPQVIRQAFKIHRELDCFVENYIGLVYCVNKRKNIKDYQFIGIMNGGVELPYILSLILGAELNKVSFINLNNNKLYIDRHASDTPLPIVPVQLQPNYIILDDNVLTGKTIDDVYKLLKTENNDTLLFLIRHPNLNRIEQARIYDSTPNLNEYNKLIFGMLFNSPFSKLSPNTNYNNEYLDELGVFTKSGDKFLRCLYKNKMFKANSEVAQIKGFLSEGIWKN